MFVSKNDEGVLAWGFGKFGFGGGSWNVGWGVRSGLEMGREIIGEDRSGE